jgi:hypothetical protein
MYENNENFAKIAQVAGKGIFVLHLFKIYQLLISHERMVPGQPGQDRLCRISKTGLLGQGNENMAANTGQRGKRAVAGQLGQDSWDRKAWAGQDSWRMSGWYRQDMKGRTGWPEHDRRTGQLAQDN